MAKSPKQKNKSKFKRAWLLGLIALLCVSVPISLSLADRYTFLSGGIPFLFPSLLIGLPLGILCTVGVIRIGGKKKKFWSIVGFFALLSLTLCAIILSFALNLNCLFDTSEPQKLTVVIEDKEFDGHYKSVDYKFIFTYEGKEYSIEIPISVYNRYEEDDLFEIELRQGAFHRPFFIADLD